jgi:DNA-binding transcriptional MerR regulator
MRIGELSRRSGVSVPTIKFYLREGLLPAGVATAANQAEYGETHVQRLQLIRAMIDAGRLSVARTREILRALDSGRLAPHDLLGVAHDAVTHPVRTDRDDPAFRTARAEIEALARERGWFVEPDARAIDQAADAVRTLRALGADDLLALRDTYADAAQAVAQREVAAVVARRDPARMVEAVVAGTVLGETLLNAFRLLAQESASARTLSAADVENRGRASFPGKASPRTDGD